MIATCVHNRSSALADHQRGRLLAVDEEFYLTIGDLYVVLGMGIFETVLCLLIRDDSGGPSFAPAGLFDCSDQTMPAGWSFSLLEPISYSGRDLWTRCIAMWGYDELVREPGHASALGERNDDALQIFFRELMRREREVGDSSDGTALDSLDW